MSSNNVLLEINAGKCKIDGKSVVPETEKGKILLIFGGDELLHFKWQSREDDNESKELDFLVFPGDAAFTRVTQSAGRVYLLKFQTSGDRHFFWLQDMDCSRDATLADEVTSIIENFPPDNDSLEQKSESEEDVGGLPNSQYTPEQLTQLTNLLQSLPGSSSNSGPDIDLSSIFSKDIISQLVKIPSAFAELSLYLPDDVEKTPEEIVKVLTSPQCHQCTDSVIRALHSGELGGLLVQFGLDPDTFTVKELLNAIKEKFRKL